MQSKNHQKIPLNDNRGDKNDLFNDLVSIKPKSTANTPMNNKSTPLNSIQQQSNIQKHQPQPATVKNTAHHDFDVDLLTKSTPKQSPELSKKMPSVVSSNSKDSDDYLDLFHPKAQLQPQPSQISDDFSIFDTQHSRSTTKPPIPNTRSSTAPPVMQPKQEAKQPILPQESDLVTKLTQMGFSASSATQALLLHNNNLNDAVDYLITGGDATHQPIPPQQSAVQSVQALTSSLFSKASKLTSAIKNNISSNIPVAIPTGTHFNPVDANKDGLYDNKPSIKPLHHPKQQQQNDELRVQQQQRLHFYASLEPNLLIQLAESKSKGDILLKQGQYGDALLAYKQLLNNQIEIKHPLIALILSSIAHCQIETGLFKDCVNSADLAIKSTTLKQGNLQEMANTVVDITVDEHVFKVNDLITVFVYKAMGLEAMEKYEKLLEFVTELKQIPNIQPQELRIIRDIHNRAIEAQQPKQKQPPVLINNDKSTLNTLNSFVDVNQSKRVQEMRLEQQAKEVQEQQQFIIKDEVDAKVKNWSLGKEHNIRILLTTVGPLMKEIGIEWLDIPISGIMQPNQIKKQYMKTVGKIHPDKVFKINIVAAG